MGTNESSSTSDQRAHGVLPWLLAWMREQTGPRSAFSFTQEGQWISAQEPTYGTADVRIFALLLSCRQALIWKPSLAMEMFEARFLQWTCLSIRCGKSRAVQERFRFGQKRHLEEKVRSLKRLEIDKRFRNNFGTIAAEQQGKPRTKP
jgi:hypothetical protein